MRKLFLFLASILILTSCKKNEVRIAVYNDTNLQRNKEIVELCMCGFGDKLPLKRGDQLIVLDKNNKQVPYQILADHHTLLFEASVDPNDSSFYTVTTGIPEKFTVKTFGRFVPERKDDFAWENDKIAFRMYGPALAKENPSNGVDVWLKRTNNLIINKFYKNDLAGIQSYHVDNGEGLDCYKVAHSLGAGGIAPYIDTTLFIGSHYNKFKVIENGPLRTQFMLTYDTLKIGKSAFTKAYLSITLNAGSQFNEASVYYMDNTHSIQRVGMGIFLHDSIGSIQKDISKGYIAYAEKAVSDSGVPEGKSYVGIIVPTPIDTIITKNKHLLAIAKYRAKRTFVYYFGAGWSKYGFPTEKGWFDYVEQSAVKIKNPLRIEVKK